MHEIHANRCCWLYLQLAECRVVDCAAEADNGWVTGGLDCWQFKGRTVVAEPPITEAQFVKKNVRGLCLGQKVISF